MTDESLQVITIADENIDFEVRVHEVFELQLGVMPASGHLWEFIDLPGEIVVESWRREPQGDPDPDGLPAPGAGTVRVWQLHATGPGVFDLQLRCWQPWEGAGSIIDTFDVTIEAS